ncbi:hypothetical protein QE429_001070 [Bacillus sp. SORGH_AS 510]|nr:hypothetical protein [Bacillus sp. SORGH_AS_0510]
MRRRSASTKKLLSGILVLAGIFLVFYYYGQPFLRLVMM